MMVVNSSVLTWAVGWRWHLTVTWHGTGLEYTVPAAAVLVQCWSPGVNKQQRPDGENKAIKVVKQKQFCCDKQITAGGKSTSSVDKSSLRMSLSLQSIYSWVTVFIFKNSHLYPDPTLFTNTITLKFPCQITTLQSSRRFLRRPSLIRSCNIWS